MSGSRSQKAERGQDLVETALVLPVLLLLFLGVIEFGIIVFSRDTVANVAREGARYGVIAGRTPAEIEAYMQTRAPGLSRTGAILDPRVITLTETSVTTVVTYTFPLLSGPIIEVFGGNPNATVWATSTMNRE